MQWIEGGQAWPFVQVVDGESTFHAPNTDGLTLAQVADNYGAWSPNKTPREVQIRQCQESTGAGPWETFTVSPAPLEQLAWNQGWPSNDVLRVDVLDDSTHFNAENPERWTLARAAADYGSSYACLNQEPHEVQVRDVGPDGNGEWETFTVPVVP